MNHGGLFGRANVENFPNVNDYRNIVVAEAMKVLGFVNRHSRGVLRVQKELETNENGEAVYDFSYKTAVLVTEKKSSRADRMIIEAINNGLLIENGEKRSDSSSPREKKSNKIVEITPEGEKQTKKQTKKQTRKTISEFSAPLVEEVYKAIKMNRKAKYSWLADNLGVSERTIQRAINDLKILGYINKEHSKRNGEWQLLK